MSVLWCLWVEGTIDYDHYIDAQQVRLRLHQLATSTLLPLRVGASSGNLVIYYLRRFLGCAVIFCLCYRSLAAYPFSGIRACPSSFRFGLDAYCDMRES